MPQVTVLPLPQLSTIAPDADAIQQQLASFYASQNDPLLNEFIVSSVGDALNRAILAVGVASMTIFGRTLQEAFGDTSVIPTSDIRQARDHGVHVYRAVPAQVQVTLNRNVVGSSLAIPVYSVFNVAGTQWFNRDPIVLSPGNSTVTATLYKGALTTEQYIVDGSPYLLFYVGPSDFSVSDDDIFVIDGVNVVQPVRNGLYHYNASAFVFAENTLPDGRVECQFGEGIFGYSPLAGATLRFIYAITDGSAGNGLPSGQSVTFSQSSDVVGTTTTVSSQGNDRLSSAFYKRNSPYLYASKGQAVTKNDYNALMQTYPGVVCARARFQRDVNPGDVRYMNIMEATVLWEGAIAPTPTQWFNFTRFIETKIGIATVHVIKRDPVPVMVPILVTAFLNRIADLNSTQQQLLTNIQQLFVQDDTILGRGIVLSDLYRIVEQTSAFITPDTVLDADQQDAIPLVDYVEVTVPVMDVIIQPWQYVVPGNIVVNVAYSERITATQTLNSTVR